MAQRTLESFNLGPLSLRNRLVMAPITTQYADERGRVTAQLRAHYETRARGGVALIIVEASYVLPVGQAFANQLGIYDDQLVPGLAELALSIKRHGCAAAIQLHHGGRMAKSSLSGLQPVAPSAIADPRGELPRALDETEIRATEHAFARAAERAREAGFDGVEIHGAHAYLIDQFISPASNRRADAYGGSVENRARFLVEVLTTVREAVGSGYPVWVRMNGREYGVEGGTTPEDAGAVARLAEDAGAAAIHVSAYGPATPTNRTTAVFKPAVIAGLAASMKRSVSIPVIAVGRITPDAAEELLESGAADLVAMGKALLADPELPRKLTEGREDEVVPCIACMHCRDCLMLAASGGIRCQVNPGLGCDHEPPALPATVSRRVLVVGGGPAGMVAALAAARRGHAVTLWEKERALGGQLLQAAVPPHKDRIGFFTRYLVRELGRSGVKVELQREASVNDVVSWRPDAVIVATGARPLKPDIPGLARAGAVEAGAVLDGSVRPGRRVVVIGGELVGCETAEYLAEHGRIVTLVRRGPEMAAKIGPSLRAFVLERLRQKGVAMLTGVRYVEATPAGLTVALPDGQSLSIRADTLVLATGYEGEAGLYRTLRGKVLELHAAGDCLGPESIGEAVRTGYAAGCRV